MIWPLFLLWLTPVQAQPPESDIYNHEWVTGCREMSGLEVESWDDFMTMSYQLRNEDGSDADIIVITLGHINENESEWIDCRIKPDGAMIITDYRDISRDLLE